MVVHEYPMTLSSAMTGRSCSDGDSLVIGPHIRPPRLLIALYLRLPRRLPLRPNRRCRPRRRLGCRIGRNGSSN